MKERDFSKDTPFWQIEIYTNLIIIIIKSKFDCEYIHYLETIADTVTCKIGDLNLTQQLD